MKVVYTAPNRSHHYKYAAALNAAGCLHAFVSGFPRISPRAKLAEVKDKLHRADILQTLYVISLKFQLPAGICNWLTLMSKKEQDRACRKFVKDCDIFLFFNGSGLGSSRYGKTKGVITIVEAVSSHVEYQEEIMEEEYHLNKLPWTPFPIKEKTRRLKEYEEADYILFPSEFVRRSFIAKGFEEIKLLKVPYGFDKLGGYHKKEFAGNAKEHFTILFVGSISVRKGLKYLIEAFKKLQYPGKKLVIVGPETNDGALKDVVITPDIIFPGILKGKQLEDVYKSADVFCLPSVEEGLALVLGEALSFGLPIIATCNTGADDIFVDGREGYIVPIRDSEAILQKLQLICDNPDLLSQIRSNSFARSMKLDGWEQTGRNLVDSLYKIFQKETFL